MTSNHTNTPAISPTHGSYLPTDVQFLLNIIPKSTILSTDPAKKEQLIQSGKRHYSDMLTFETAPDPTHSQLYRQALHRYSSRMAMDIHRLAGTLYQCFKDKVCQDNPLILVSLVRAGLPMGVLLKRAFDDQHAPYTLPSYHYGISIIRDRGIDELALGHIIQTHPKSPIVFVDGWTGKGAIFGELMFSLNRFCQTHPTAHTQIYHHDTLPLVVLADPAGVAWLSASDDDWLIPSSLLGSTISGLISRTLWNDDGFHRAVFYDELSNIDESLNFVHAIDSHRQTDAIQQDQTILTPKPAPTFATRELLKPIASAFDVGNVNLIKPTIAEATRAVLRRDPQCVLVADFGDDTALLRHLCEQKNVPLYQMDILPYQAITIIKKARKKKT